MRPEAEKPRSTKQAEKPRSREVRNKPRSREAEKPPGKPRSLVYNFATYDLLRQAICQTSLNGGSVDGLETRESRESQS